MASELEVGKIGVGAAPSGYQLDVVTTGNNGIRTDNGTAQIYLGTISGNASVGTLTDHTFNLIANGGSKVAIDSTGQSTFTREGLTIVGNRTGSDGDSIHVRKDNYTRLRLTTLGITFPNGGTAPVAAANNRLDYYGEGSWTPTVTAGSISGSNISYTGKYTRIGDTVHINLKISSTANDLVIGSYVGISGLPFTVNESASGYYTTEDINLQHGGEASAGGTVVYLSAGGSATSTQYIYLSLTYYV